MRNAARILLLMLIFLLLWQFTVIIFHLPNYLLPLPREVIVAFINNYALILANFWPTLLETVCGFCLATLLGSMAAITLIASRWLRYWFLPVLLISQALPTFAIAPLLVVWFGYGMLSKILVCVLMLFFPITSGFYDGMRRASAGYLDLAQTMNAKSSQTLWRIKIPSGLPGLASGLRIAATFAPMGAVIGEWVGSSRGLGFLMLNANARMQIDLMFAVLAIVIIFTLGFYFFVDYFLTQLIQEY